MAEIIDMSLVFEEIRRYNENERQIAKDLGILMLEKDHQLTEHCSLEEWEEEE